jgi:hypothetical protein
MERELRQKLPDGQFQHVSSTAIFALPHMRGNVVDLPAGKILKLYDIK